MVVTVISETWSAAQRWIAPLIISRAFFSPFSLASASISLTRAAASLFASVSIVDISSFLASSLVILETFSSSWTIFSSDFSSSCCFLLSSFWWFWTLLICCSRCSFFLERTSSFLSSASSFWISLNSCFWISFLRSFDSLSKSCLSFKTSSFASSIASFFKVLASIFASSTIDWATFLALPIFLLSTNRVTNHPPQPAAAMHNTGTTINQARSTWAKKKFSALNDINFLRV